MPKVPPIPDDVLKQEPREVFDYVLQALIDSVHDARISTFLEMQRESCIRIIGASERVLDEGREDELVQKYAGFWGDCLKDSERLAEDGALVFFVACQLYVTRVVEAVRWFKLHVANKFPLGAEYESAEAIRTLGKPAVGKMTIAGCCWTLGNLAKHRDQVEELSAKTSFGLNAIGLDAKQRDVAIEGLAKIAGVSHSNFTNLKQAVIRVCELLSEWAEALEDRLVEDLDEMDFGDRTRTRRRNTVPPLSRIFEVRKGDD